MPYITKEYYENEYHGVTTLEEADFNRLARRAGDVIDIITNHKLVHLELSKQPIFIQEQVKKAIAAQIDYLVTSGESNAMGAGGFGQASAGNFSYGDKAGVEGLSREQQMTSGAVIQHLMPTGLMYQGIDVYD